MSGIFLLMFFACLAIPVLVGLWAGTWMLFDKDSRPRVRRPHL